MTPEQQSRFERRSVTLRLYETERKLPNRNFAKGHSFEEWLEREREREDVQGKWDGCSLCIPVSGHPNVLTHLNT